MAPRMELLADTWVAITGANVSPRLDGEPIPMWQAVPVSKGSRLEFRSPKDGMRAYLAVAGGIDVPQVMGSRATYLKAAIGGIEGRPFRAGDILNTLASETTSPAILPAVPDAEILTYGSSHELRVVLGPQQQAFTQQGIDTLLGSTYTVSINSDRMGYRLEGDPIEHTDGPDVISDGTPLGAIQVPGDGQPIILLADRGTTGGYTKIATVISPDLNKVAQAMPGHTITFHSVSVEEAQAAYRAQEDLLRSIRNAAVPTPRLAIVLNDAVSDILTPDGEPIILPGADETAPRAQTGKATVQNAEYEVEISIRRLN